MLDSTDNQRGFTVTELLIAATVGGVLAVTLFTITLFMYGGVLQNDSRAKLLVESQNILRNIVDELRVGSGVRVSNTIADANEPPGGWTTSNDDLILIIASPALDDDGDFIVDPLTGDPYQNEIIYFADELTLYKRVLAHPGATGTTAQTTCPEGATSSTCPADRKLSEHFDTMSFIFYDQDNATTNDPTLARSIAITIEMLERVVGQDIEIDNQIRITLRNKLS